MSTKILKEYEQRERERYRAVRAARTFVGGKVYSAMIIQHFRFRFCAAQALKMRESFARRGSTFKPPQVHKMEKVAPGSAVARQAPPDSNLAA